MARKTKTKPTPVPPEPFREVGETFRCPRVSSICYPNLAEPWAMNGDVGVRKYRVTVELIDEPIEVIHERLRKLWAECDNHHSWDPIREEAKRYGLTLDIKDVGKAVPHAR